LLAGDTSTIARLGDAALIIQGRVSDLQPI
jgi:hypothetical protein